MIEGHHIDAVLTDDETELVRIINGLEEQSEALEHEIEKSRHYISSMSVGLAAFAGLALETSNTDRTLSLAMCAALTFGGIRKIIHERRTVNDIRDKNVLANQLKQELEPTDLERYEERDELDFDEEDDDEEYYMT